MGWGLIFLTSVLAFDLAADPKFEVLRPSSSAQPILQYRFNHRTGQVNDSDGHYLLWLVGFAMTQNIREQNYANPETAESRWHTSIGLNPALVKILLTNLKRRPWAKELVDLGDARTLRNRDFFERIYPHLIKEFNPGRLGGFNSESLVAVAQSLEFAWVPRFKTRTPLSIVVQLR